MRKASLVLLSLAISRVCFATVDLGSPSAGTPYDRFMDPVKRVLTHLDGDRPNMDRVRELMHQGRSFRYSFTNPYTPSSPESTAARRAGDCKDKALWLADQLNDPSVRFVIGRARRNSRISHAWLMWQHDNRWWILDCTNNREPVAADHVSASEYIPFFSYARNGAYRHESTRLMFAENVAGHTDRAVAGNRR
jgi:hypothetical protein